MNRITSALLAVGVAASLPLAAIAQNKDVNLNKLPKNVQQTIRTYVGNDRIRTLDQDERGGQRVYEVEWEAKDGKNWEMTLDEKGMIIEKSRSFF